MDEDLVERSRRGEIVAYGALVERHRRAALRVAYAIAGSDGEDAVQEAFVKAHQALPRFREGAPFRPWLLRIVANEARNHVRRNRRQVELALREGLRSPTGGMGVPDDVVVGEEERRQLVLALSALPDRDREVIALRWFAGLSEAEMAIALECRPGTVKSRLSRALDRLRALLPEEAIR